MAGQVEKSKTDVVINAPAKQFFDVFCSRTNQIANICAPVKSVEIREDGKACVAKEVIESIDRAHSKMTFKVIEGDLLQDYESFKFLLQVTPKQNGGIVHWTLLYEKLMNNVLDRHSMMQLLIRETNDVDAHLATHAYHN